MRILLRPIALCLAVSGTFACSHTMSLKARSADIANLPDGAASFKIGSKAEVINTAASLVKQDTQLASSRLGPLVLGASRCLTLQDMSNHNQRCYLNFKLADSGSYGVVVDLYFAEPGSAQIVEIVEQDPNGV